MTFGCPSILVWSCQGSLPALCMGHSPPTPLSLSLSLSLTHTHTHTRVHVSASLSRRPAPTSSRSTVFAQHGCPASPSMLRQYVKAIAILATAQSRCHAAGPAPTALISNTAPICASFPQSAASARSRSHSAGPASTARPPRHPGQGGTSPAVRDGMLLCL